MRGIGHYGPLVLALALSTRLANSDTLCSSDNTGSGDGVYYQFQSMGWCENDCQGSAYAIIQGFMCWCSDVSPSATVDVDQCSETCPGYKDNKCGNTDEGLYIYYQIGQPSSTQAASSSTEPTTSATPTSSSDEPDSSSSEPAVKTVYVSDTGDSSSSTSSSSSSSSPTSPTSSSADSLTSSSLNEPSVKTVFVTPTPSSSSSSTSSSSPSSTSSTSTPSSTLSSSASSTRASSSTSTSAMETKDAEQSDSSGGFFHQKGKVAGVFVVVGLVALALLLLLGWFIYRRRRREREEDLAFSTMQDIKQRPDGSPPPPAPLISKIFSSKHSRSGSRAGLTGAAAAPPYWGSHGGNGRDAPMTMDTQHHEGDIDGDPYASALVVDQRVDPRSFMMRFDSNYSRTSLRDEEDYSRKVFRVTNPDDHRNSEDGSATGH